MGIMNKLLDILKRNGVSQKIFVIFKRCCRFVFIMLFVILFLITIFINLQNRKDYKKTENVIKSISVEIDKICDSGCTDYPEEWIQANKKLEAENYCLRQCMDKGKMKEDLTEIIKSNFLYRSKAHKIVSFAFCAIGFGCPWKY